MCYLLIIVIVYVVKFACALCVVAHNEERRIRALYYHETEELTDNEVLILAEKSGAFNFLNDKKEDIYTRFDGQKIDIVTGIKTGNMNG